jgi:precorrin-6x reductase
MTEKTGKKHAVVIFGGTTEGRLLAGWCSENRVSALYCAATETGALVFPGVSVCTGRLDAAGMAELLRGAEPRIVLDATHPYAVDASRNIGNACRDGGINLLRVLRGASDISGCEIFESGGQLAGWLAAAKGVIFAATGLKEAELFAGIPDFSERVFFRMLPSVEGLASCLRLGYPANHLILMYGPFSKEMNRAMFLAAKAEILVTKDSGAEGGFREKAEAAKELGMKIALLSRPDESASGGVSVDEAKAMLLRLKDFLG